MMHAHFRHTQMQLRGSCREFPPESLLEHTQRGENRAKRLLGNQDVWATRIGDAGPKEQPEDRVKHSGQNTTEQRVSSRVSTANDNVRVVSAIPEGSEVARITLPIGVDREQVGRTGRAHAVGDGA